MFYLIQTHLFPNRYGVLEAMLRDHPWFWQDRDHTRCSAMLRTLVHTLRTAKTHAGHDAVIGSVSINLSVICGNAVPILNRIEYYQFNYFVYLLCLLTFSFRRAYCYGILDR